jgi:hypothetical protein
MSSPIVFALLCFLAIATVTLARRRHYHYYVPAEPAYKIYQDQSARVTKIIADPRISILDQDGLSANGAAYPQNRMCPYFRKNVYKDKTWLHNKVMVPLTQDVRDDVAKVWMSIVYTKAAFPFTFRSEGVYVDTSSETFDQDVWNYYLQHCALEEENWEKRRKDEQYSYEVSQGVLVMFCFIGFLSIMMILIGQCFTYTEKGYKWAVKKVREVVQKKRQ